MEKLQRFWELLRNESGMRLQLQILQGYSLPWLLDTVESDGFLSLGWKASPKEL